jgi:hypothetical protein
MRHPALLAAVAAVVLAVPATAQSAPQTRDDSLAVGRKVITWINEFATDSIWNRMGPQLRQALQGRDGLQNQLDQMTIELGAETGVVSESVAAKDGNLLYTREASFENMVGDTGVWRLEIAPDGTIVNGRLQPKSRIQPQQAKPDSAAK